MAAGTGAVGRIRMPGRAVTGDSPAADTCIRCPPGRPRRVKSDSCKLIRSPILYFSTDVAESHLIILSAHIMLPLSVLELRDIRASLGGLPSFCCSDRVLRTKQLSSARTMLLKNWGSKASMAPSSAGAPGVAWLLAATTRFRQAETCSATPDRHFSTYSRTWLLAQSIGWTREVNRLNAGSGTAGVPDLRCEGTPRSRLRRTHATGGGPHRGTGCSRPSGEAHPCRVSRAAAPRSPRR